MAISDSLASNTASAQPQTQDVQTLITLLGDLVPLLLRVQSQSNLGAQAFLGGQAFSGAQASLLASAELISNPLLDQQAAVNFVENIATDAIHTVSNYLESRVAQHRELEVIRPILSQASNALAVHDHAQSFNSIWQAYRLIAALRSVNPQLPPPRSEATKANSAASSDNPSTQH
jgi:hypothetical protein